MNKKYIKQQNNIKSLREGTTKQSQLKTDIAVKVSNVSKVFKIPHAKIDSMRSMFVNMYRKRTYEKFHALEDISFDVKKGDFLGIIGHNGAGKSTLLKILAGVYHPTTGDVCINGMISPFLELGIGFNPELSGRDNIYLNATVLGLSKEQIDQKFDEIVAFAELENFIDEQVKNYSSGMQTRLAFSVSIHVDRDILLMDEVLAVGDTRFSQKCLNIFKGYKNQNKTVILVTHDIGSVREYCDKAILFHKGRILKAGNVDDVCDEYLIANTSEDQRKELERQEKRKKNERKKQERIQRIDKNKKDYINDIRVFDKNGNELTTLTRNDDFFVEVELKISKRYSNFILAVQIFDNETNSFLCGNNTKKDNFECDWEKGTNIFKIYFKNTMFNEGSIYIRAVLSDKQGKETKVVDLSSTK